MIKLWNNPTAINRLNYKNYTWIKLNIIYRLINVVFIEIRAKLVAILDAEKIKLLKYFNKKWFISKIHRLHLYSKQKRDRKRHSLLIVHQNLRWLKVNNKKRETIICKWLLNASCFIFSFI